MLLPRKSPERQVFFLAGRENVNGEKRNQHFFSLVNMSNQVQLVQLVHLVFVSIYRLRCSTHVKNAVTVHGGTVTALPTPGGGLTVRFTLQA